MKIKNKPTIELTMEKERATAEDECDLCTRPMRPNMTLWVFEGDYALFAICDDCRRKHERKGETT